MPVDNQRAPRGRRYNIADTCVRPDLHAYNPTTTLTYDADSQIIQVDLDDGTDQVRQILTWTNGCVTAIGPWVKL